MTKAIVTLNNNGSVTIHGGERTLKDLDIVNRALVSLGWFAFTKGGVWYVEAPDGTVHRVGDCITIGPGLEVKRSK